MKMVKFIALNIANDKNCLLLKEKVSVSCPE